MPAGRAARKAEEQRRPHPFVDSAGVVWYQVAIKKVQTDENSVTPAKAGVQFFSFYKSW